MHAEILNDNKVEKIRKKKHKNLGFEFKYEKKKKKIENGQNQIIFLRGLEKPVYENDGNY